MMSCKVQKVENGFVVCAWRATCGVSTHIFKTIEEVCVFLKDWDIELVRLED